MIDEDGGVRALRAPLQGGSVTEDGGREGGTVSKEDLWTRTAVTVAALVGLALKLLVPERVDATAVALLVLALIPWMSTILQRIDTVAGGVVLREIKKTQAGQQQEMERMKFLFEHLVPREELRHLQALADGTPLPYDSGYTRPLLDAELRRLTGTGLIERLPGRTFAQMGEVGDVREHFALTDAGRAYLEILNGYRARE
ncbi:hypothetical protein ADK47_09340 [Streptomyces rimosus subsp. rimosus]|uniref:Uncharacterized protein n=1 Tax=Streptomyces rimosus subsp. rimosus TaxID=132474 RepID=A0ABY3YW01_STRRM|nr:hypothetical protein DF17_26970 [Streptomyces rimosus]KOG78977.1 hypothetical protein ADK78_06935 [Kitasatospora aureofaciens]KOT43027.1 hypothetical protein ADK42_08475 [Streptomyces rimosus subsp. rimosus]KOT44983.1 hypothetical protein ADK84_05750 [Streptomyces sp. NRRL WC-3701]KEF18242.1 hypothetical protein DF18_25260 [Streptomyces rimosus]